MSKTNLEMYKMNRSQMNNVSGGYDEQACMAVQIIANHYEKYGATDAQWDEWCDNFYRHCV